MCNLSILTLYTSRNNWKPSHINLNDDDEQIRFIEFVSVIYHYSMAGFSIDNIRAHAHISFAIGL